MTGMGRAQTAPPRTAASQQDAVPSRPALQSSLPIPAPITINRKLIVLDPAHGGVDSGSQISDTTVEKDVTLALAYRLRSLLTARGFTVVMTRDADVPSEPDAAGTALTLDDRAGMANHAHAAACLVLHATGSGTGVHLYRSELEFSRSGISLVTSNASVRPIDSLTCPALVVELAPSGDDADSINNTDYQQRVALAIAGAMLFWQDEVRPPARLSASIGATAGRSTQSDTTGAQP